MKRKVPVLILGIALLCRLSLAVGRSDMIWPDEQFQTLEPASQIVFGHSYLAWEWLRGFRTWLLPAFFAPILYCAKVLGLKSGLAVIQFTRGAMAFLDVLSWALLFKLLGRMQFQIGTRLLVLILAAFLPKLQLWGVSTLQDHMAMILMVVALWVGFDANRSAERSWRRVIAGFLFGSLGWLKIQLGLFSTGWVLMLSIQKGRRTRSVAAGVREAFPWISGGVAALLAMALVDLATYGVFAQSTLNQLLKGESISRFYGTAPWIEGLTKWIDLLGPLPWFLLALAGMLRVFMIKNRWHPENSHESIGTLLTGTALYVAVHVIIPHKETRFFLPLVPAFFILFASAWDPILAKLNESFAHGFNQLTPGRRLALWMTFAITLGTSGAIGYGIARETPNYLSSTNVTDLEDIISRVRLNLREPEKVCIFLPGHNFSWTRGALIVGAKVDYKDWPDASGQLDSQTESCELAIASTDKSESFLRKYPEFALMKKGRTSFVLLARRELLERLASQPQLQSY